VALQDRIRGDLTEAMRQGQPVRRDTLRLLLAALRNEQLERGRLALEAEQARLGRELTEAEADAFAAAQGGALPESVEQQVLARVAKRHRQSIDEFRRAGRQDLVAHEEAQLAIVRAYLPDQPGPAELEERVRAAIAETGATTRKDMGRVMARLADLRDRADMAEVSRIVQALLG